MMTMRERIRCGLLGGVPDRVPLHCRTRMAPLGPEGAWAREMGWGALGSHRGFTQRLEGCSVRSFEEEHSGRICRREIVETPAGCLTALSVPYHHGGSFTLEYLFKGEEDYAPLMAMVQAIRYEPAYDAYQSTVERLGKVGYAYSAIGYDPMHEIMIKMMGVEAFSYQWADHRDRVLELYEALRDRHREMYQIVAAGPAEFVTYGANIQPEIVGRKRFQEYYMPCYQELGQLLHRRGKRLGAHMDDKTLGLSDLIAQCPWDVMEAFAVAPDGDVSVAEARELWPGRVISLNFPSALHLAAPDAIRRATRQFIEEAGSTQGILISLTEDYPPDCAHKIFTNIAQVVHEMA